MRIRYLIGAFSAATLLLAACAPAAPASPSTSSQQPAAPPAQTPTSQPAPESQAPPDAARETAKRPTVIATFSILGDFVQNVAGDKVNLITLVSANSDVHDYEPTPSDAARLSEADLIFELGLELETWLDALYRTSGSQARRVVVSEGAMLREGGHAHETDADHAHDDEHGHSEEKAKEADHAHGEFDPHIWQDPRNAIQIVRNIEAALSALDPANADFYKANAQAYIAQLEALDEEIASLVAQLPETQRKLLTSHEALGYFAARYGFEVIGSVLGSTTTETSEPSASDIARLVEQVRESGVKVIFLENIPNARVVEQLAKEANITVGPVLFTDALGEPGSPIATYLEAMRYNGRMIVETLQSAQ